MQAEPRELTSCQGNALGWDLTHPCSDTRAERRAWQALGATASLRPCLHHLPHTAWGVGGLPCPGSYPGREAGSLQGHPEEGEETGAGAALAQGTLPAVWPAQLSWPSWVHSQAKGKSQLESLAPVARQ